MRGLKRHCGLIAVFFTAITLLSNLVACINTHLKKYKETHSLMDTFLTIPVYSPNGMIAQEAMVVNTIRKR